MLEICNLETGYGKKQVLFGISVYVKKGEIVALIGPNGSGKSTVLKAACGLIRTWRGEIRLDGIVASNATPAQNVGRGMTLAPQGNRVFHDLTLMENLEIGGFQLPSKELKKRIAVVLDVFPFLGNLRRCAGKLSGGEQQMLALARALMPAPRILLVDEPSLGLSPNLVSVVFRKIVEISRETTVGILIVEQRVKDVLKMCNKVYSLKEGRVQFSGSPRELEQNTTKLRELFI